MKEDKIPTICPKCDYDLIEKDSGIYKSKKWVYKICTNDECDYYINTEPDWDLLKGSKNYE